MKINALVGTLFAITVLVKVFFTVGPAVMTTSAGMMGVPTGGSSSKSSYVTAKGKAANVQKYGLEGEQVASFDLCSKLLSKSGKAPGDLGTYCGCVSKHATYEFSNGHKPTAILLVSAFRSQGRMSIAEINDVVSEEAVNVTRTAAAHAVVQSMTTCREEAINEASRLKASS